MPDNFSPEQLKDLSDQERGKEFYLTDEEKEILKNLPVEINEEDILELKRISKIIGGDLGMKVRIGEPGKGSFFNTKEIEIVLDPLYFAEKPEEGRMVAAHEGGHRRLTRGPQTIGLKPDLIEKLYGQLIGFAYLNNVIEDPTVNSWVTKEFEGLKSDFEKTYDKMLTQEHVPLGLNHPEIQAIISRTGTIPNVVWFGSELIRYGQGKKFSREIKKRRPIVARALGQSLRPAIKAFGTLPETTFNESEVIEKARERFRIIYEEIWPHLQALIEEDKKNEAKRQMLQEQIKQQGQKTEEQQGQQKGGDQQKKSNQTVEDIEKGQTNTPLDKLPKDLRQELAKAIKKGRENQQQDLTQEKETLKQEEEKIERERREIEKKKRELEERAQRATSPKEKEEIEKELKKINQQKAVNANQKEQINQKKKNHQKRKTEVENGTSTPIEMNGLSEELKKALDKIFKELPKKDQERLNQGAGKTLKELEDKLNKEIGSKLNNDQAESHAEHDKRIEREEEAKKEQEKKEGAFEETKRKAREIAEASKTEYDRIRAEVDDIIEDLHHRLEEFFIRERHPKWQKGYRSGPRLNVFRAMQFASGAKTDAYREMWDRKTAPQRFDYKFSLVIDTSSSMSKGGKITETRKAVIVLAEVLKRLGIDFEILVFNGYINVMPIKDFENEFTTETEGNIVNYLSSPEGSTPTSSALERAHQGLKNYHAKDNFIVMLTDGQPCPEGQKPTKKLVREILQNEELVVKIIGLGLGQDTEFVKQLFPSALSNIEAKDLPETLAALLEEMITNPEQFNFDEENKQNFLK